MVVFGFFVANDLDESSFDSPTIVELSVLFNYSAKDDSLDDFYISLLSELVSFVFKRSIIDDSSDALLEREKNFRAQTLLVEFVFLIFEKF